METVVIFALAGCFLCAGVTYVVMDYRSHNERQGAMENVLSVQAEVGSFKKKLLGYTKFADYLVPGKQAVAENMRSFTTKVLRDYVHIETIPKETLNRKSNGSVIVKYSVEFSFAFDPKPESFEIVATTTGIEIHLKKPTLITQPLVKNLFYEVPPGVEPFDEKINATEIHPKLAALAQQHTSGLSNDETIRALCEKKLIEFLRTFLLAQSGVTQVPCILIIYK